MFPIVLPPLRERREDIPKLAAHFAERAATRFGLSPVAPKPEDLALLTAYSWPGNVRELAAVIDRAAILGDGKRLDVATALGVGDNSLHKATAAGRTRFDGSPTETSSTATIEPLDTAIRRHVEAACGCRRAH